jgi:hypothetical protein
LIATSVPVALYVAYAMAAHAASPQSICLKILRLHVRQHDVWGYARPQVVFFDGLTREQIHAQCVQIRDKVVRHLPLLEAAAIRARYGSTEFEDIEGRRRYAFSLDRANAIKALSDHFGKVYDTLTETERDLLVSRACADRRRTPITLRGIAETCGRSHVHYHHYFHAIDDQIYLFEVRALDLLTAVFAERGSCNGEPLVEEIGHAASGR